MLVLSDGGLVVARCCVMLRDANVGVLRRRECHDERNEAEKGCLTESRVRTKLSTSIERVAPSRGLSSAFLLRTMLMMMKLGFLSGRW